MAYQAGMDAYNAALDQQKLAYDAQLQNAGFTQDAIDNAYRQQSLAYDAALQNAALQFDAYDRQLELAQLAAKYDDYSGLNALGITPTSRSAGSGNLSYTPAYNPTAETPTDTPSDTPLDAKQYGVTQYVNVPGYGRVTVEELARLIDAGVIREVAKSDGSYDYVVTGKTANKVVALTR